MPTFKARLFWAVNQPQIMFIFIFVIQSQIVFSVVYNYDCLCLLLLFCHVIDVDSQIVTRPLLILCYAAFQVYLLEIRYIVISVYDRYYLKH